MNVGKDTVIGMLENPAGITIITGHYGSGKTNLSLNLAIALRRMGREVALADLDIVNPYFRSADFAAVSSGYGVSLIAPAYAGSSVDIPALTGELDARLYGAGAVIIDVGGDDAGAYALGRYAPRLSEVGYEMLYVANFFRYLTRTAGEAAAMMAEIEAASRLRVTGIVNNSNLAEGTLREDVLISMEKARELSDITGRPLVFTGVNRVLAGEMEDIDGIFPVDIYVRPVWG